MSEENLIKNLIHFGQKLCFNGLLRQNDMYPTDIDMFLDYNGNSFLYFEGKYGDKSLPYGQKLALQNVIDSHNKAGHLSAAVIFRHSVTEGEVIVKDQIVYEMYRTKQKGWESFKKTHTVAEFLNAWEKDCENKGIKIWSSHSPPPNGNIFK
ncbi:MAG: hypothetical protein AVO38_15965 [delta proteobacterium ML8_D]|jgi:hypothetical protein|nr:MAG: hypothetical protein AVO38_15965 [delta proteobacterium ML8_D]